MSLIDESAGSPPARPVVYPAADDQADHRLRSGFVPLITFVVIVAAAAVTAAVVFGGGGPARSGPPNGFGLGQGSAAVSDGKSIRAGVRQSSQRATQSQDDNGSPGRRDSKGQVTVGSIPLSLAPGWKVGVHDGSYLSAYNPRETVGFSVEDFAALPDNTITDVLAFQLEFLGSQMLGLQTVGSPIDTGLKGTRFQESIEQQYTATAERESGDTYEEVGRAGVLFNPETGDAALIRFWAAAPTTLNASDSDIRAMIKSMMN